MTREIRALIVDDSGVTRKAVMQSIQDTQLADFTFIEAENGQEALDKYAPDQIDVMFVDLHMPVMDGPTFLKTLHATPARHAPAILVTAETDMGQITTAVKEADVAGFLFKPLDPERLSKGLKTLLDSIPVRQGPSAVPHGECVGQAIQSVLSQMCAMELTPEASDPALRSGQVLVGAISVHGDVQWSLVLGFERSAAAPIAGKFAGFDIPDDSADLGDAIGELTNIFAGSVQRLLAEQGMTINITLPTVSSVDGLRVLVQRNNTSDHAHFHCESGRLWTGVTVGLSTGLVL